VLLSPVRYDALAPHCAYLVLPSPRAQIYDPNDSGFIDLEVFREILSNLGFGDITDQDIQTLIDTADVSARTHAQPQRGRS
jgi:hypothetical protein